MKIYFKLRKLVIIGYLFVATIFSAKAYAYSKGKETSNRLEEYTIQTCTAEGCVRAAGSKAYITVDSAMMFGTAVILEVQKIKEPKVSSYLCSTFRYQFKNQILYCEVSNEKEKAAYIIKPQLEIRKFSLM